MAIGVIGGGIVFAAGLAIGAGFVEPVGDTTGGFADLAAVAAGMVFLGLVEGL